MEPRILRCHEVVKVTGLSKATIYRMVKAEAFPKPVQLGRRAVGWRRRNVEEWINSRPSV